MATFVIQDRNIGFVQWIARDVPTAVAALEQFDAHVGIWSDGRPDDVQDDWKITECSEDEAKQAEQWCEDGHPANKLPAFLE